MFSRFDAWLPDTLMCELMITSIDDQFKASNISITDTIEFDYGVSKEEAEEYLIRMRQRGRSKHPTVRTCDTF